jgi:hypothetical protein
VRQVENLPPNLFAPPTERQPAPQGIIVTVASYLDDSSAILNQLRVLACFDFGGPSLILVPPCFELEAALSADRRG